MGPTSLKKALAGNREVEITVTGRRTGRQITIPIWFVQEDETLYLLPVRGSDADWYRNLLKNPVARLATDGAEQVARTEPISNPTRVAEVVDKFRAKYGSRDVRAYYTKLDVAIEVPLTGA